MSEMRRATVVSPWLFQHHETTLELPQDLYQQIVDTHNDMTGDKVFRIVSPTKDWIVNPFVSQSGVLYLHLLSIEDTDG